MQDTNTPDTIGDDTEIFAQGRARNVVLGLFDFRFRTITALGAAPAMYLLVVVSMAIVCSFLAVLAFQRSLAEGLVWLLLICPAIFVGTILIVRVVIEFVLAILMLMVRLEETTDGVLRIVENTTDISAQTSGLPTLPTFARGLRALVGSDDAARREQRRDRRKSQQARAATQAAAEEAADLAVQEAVDKAVQRTLQEAADRAVQRAVAAAADETPVESQPGSGEELESQRPAAVAQVQRPAEPVPDRDADPASDTGQDPQAGAAASR